MLFQIIHEIKLNLIDECHHPRAQKQKPRDQMFLTILNWQISILFALPYTHSKER